MARTPIFCGTRICKLQIYGTGIAIIIISVTMVGMELPIKNWVLSTPQTNSVGGMGSTGSRRFHHDRVGTHWKMEVRRMATPQAVTRPARIHMGMRLRLLVPKTRQYRHRVEYLTKHSVSV